MSKDSDHWATPSHVLHFVRRFWPSGVDLDPCSNERSIVGARIAYTEEVDGLSQPWSELACKLPPGSAILTPDGTGPLSPPVLCYMNPPFSAPARWFGRVHREALTGLLDAVCMIHVSTSTRWWQDHVWPAAAVCFLHQRPAFLDANGEPATGNRYDCCMPYYGPDVWRFRQLFGEIGEVR